MLASLSVALPPHPGNYAFEWKWDGLRALAFVGGKKLRIESRNLLDITHQYPEIHGLAKVLRCRDAVLDGEIISLDDRGMPSFSLLQRRMHVASPATALRLAEVVAAEYMVFDLLHLDGKSLMQLPYRQRRERLEGLLPEGTHWRVPASSVGDGRAMLDAARSTMMEGIVAKELDGIYEPGRRSRSWLKIKVIQSQEFVVGGYVPERTGLAKRIGSLLLGYYDAKGRLQYAGRIGTGLSAPDHEMLLARLEPSTRSRSAFHTDPSTLPRGRWGHSPGKINYVDPALVVQVEFRRWPAGGLVQQGAFKGVRFDKKPRAVVKELAGREENIG